MKLKSVKQEDLETMSYDDVAYIILKEKGKKMKLIDLFNGVCEVLNLDQSVKDDYIAEFFTLLSTEKRFINLDKGYWDLRENHTLKIEIPAEEDEEESEEQNEDDVEDVDDEMYIDETKEIDDDEADDEYKDLVVMDEESEADL